MGFPIGMGPPGGFGGFPNQAQGVGLPFSGIPPEYEKQIEALVADEEEIPIPDVEFDHVVRDKTDFTLRSFMLPFWLRFATVGALIGLDALLLQVQFHF